MKSLQVNLLSVDFSPLEPMCDVVEAEAASEDAKMLSCRFLDISTSLGFALKVS